MAAWGGSNGGIIAGLATGTAMGVIVGSAADLMQVSRCPPHQLLSMACRPWSVPLSSSSDVDDPLLLYLQLLPSHSQCKY